MRRSVILAIVIAATISTSVKWSSAQTGNRGSELLGVLPDGGVVAVIDFQKIAGSGLWAAVNTQEKLKNVIDKAESEMADLGLKFSDVHTVAIVFPTAGMNNPTIAITGGFEQSNLLARLRDSTKVTLSSEKYKDVDIYKIRSLADATRSKEPSPTNGASAAVAGNRDETAFFFHNARTVVTGSVEAVRGSIDVKTGARPSIAQNVKLSDALAQSPGAAIRFAVALTPAMTSGLRSSEFPIPDFSSISLIFGTVDFASGIDLNATLRTDTAEHAKSLAERLNGLLGMARGFLGAMSDPKMSSIGEALKTVNIISAEIDVRITGTLPIDLLKSLLSSSGKQGQ